MGREVRAGACLCGAITYRVEGPVKGVAVCHCSQCRRQSGHCWASAYTHTCHVQIHGVVRWYASSEAAQRGFCPTCGAALFWRRNGEETLAFSLGSLDGPTRLSLQKHIFVADKGDYYDIGDGVPQRP